MQPAKWIKDDMESGKGNMGDVIRFTLKTCMWLLIVGFGCNAVMQTISHSFYRNAKCFAAADFAPEHIQFTEKLSGYGYNLSADASRVILYFGGSGYSAYNATAKFGGIFGCPFLSADFYGSQGSAGRMNLKSMQNTATDLYDWAAQRYPDKRIVVMGHSFGSGIACYLASQRDCEGLVLLAAYRDLADLYNKIIPIFWGPTKVFISNDIALKDYAKGVICETLIIGSNLDKTLDTKLQYKVKDHFANARIEIFDGIGHEDYLKDDRVVDLINASFF